MVVRAAGLRLSDIPVQERPRERLAHSGASALSEAELIALVLGVGMAGKSALDIGRGLMAEFGALDELARLDPDHLAAVPGLGHARAARLVAAFELGRRAATGRQRHLPVVRTGADAAALLMPAMVDLPDEHVRVMLLDGRNRVRRVVGVHRGGTGSAPFEPACIFRPAVASGARAIIVAHNHPSGDPAPSPEDLRATELLVSAGQALRLPLLDHLVVARGGYVSLREVMKWDPQQSPPKRHRLRQRAARFPARD